MPKGINPLFEPQLAVSDSMLLFAPHKRPSHGSNENLSNFGVHRLAFGRRTFKSLWRTAKAHSSATCRDAVSARASAETDCAKFFSASRTSRHLEQDETELAADFSKADFERRSEIRAQSRSVDSLSEADRLILLVEVDPATAQSFPIVQLVWLGSLGEPIEARINS